MSKEDLVKAIDALADDDVRDAVAAGGASAAGAFDLTEEEQGLLVAFAGEEPEVVGYAINSQLFSLQKVKVQDVTVNKAKTADKAFQAMDAYIRG